MKIERINENQIRCTLSNFDLSVRNMNLGELAYGSEKARNLFREMIQRAAKSIVVADHSKFDLTYPYHYAGWSGISRLITDQPLPDHLATVLGREKVVVARGHAAPEQQ